MTDTHVDDGTMQAVYRFFGVAGLDGAERQAALRCSLESVWGIAGPYPATPSVGGACASGVLQHPAALDLLDDFDKGSKLGLVHALVRVKGGRCFLQIRWSGVEAVRHMEQEELAREEAALHDVQLPLHFLKALLQHRHPLRALAQLATSPISNRETVDRARDDGKGGRGVDEDQPASPGGRHE